LDDAPKLRSELRYLWALFVSLKNASSKCITYSDIHAYMQIYGDLTVFEVDVVCHLDTLHSREQ